LLTVFSAQFITSLSIARRYLSTTVRY
jgi:hypothetical protein